MWQSAKGSAEETRGCPATAVPAGVGSSVAGAGRTGQQQGGEGGSTEGLVVSTSGVGAAALCKGSMGFLSSRLTLAAGQLGGERGRRYKDGVQWHGEESRVSLGVDGM